MNIKTLAILLGEHPCIVNICLGPVTVHYTDVLLYLQNELLISILCQIELDLYPFEIRILPKKTSLFHFFTRPYLGTRFT